MPNQITGREYVDVCNNYNLPYNRDSIGNTGENLTLGILGFFSIFRVFFIDGKEPIVDILIEVADEGTPYQAFAQIKSTTLLPNKQGELKASIGKDSYNAMIRRPLPTYLIAADLNKARLNIVPVFRPVQDDVKYVPVTHDLGLDDLDHLADELVRFRDDIIDYWHSVNLPMAKTSYQSLL